MVVGLDKMGHMSTLEDHKKCSIFLFSRAVTYLDTLTELYT